MKKIFKWPGGKSKEIKTIQSLLPLEFERIIEPFAGSGALSFHLEKKSILNDLDKDIINFFNTIKDENSFKLFNEKLIEICKIPYGLRDSKEYTLENLYYETRNRFNLEPKEYNLQRSIDFFVLRQLCFSGMIRISPKGAFNVPYGWYQKIGNNVTQNHHLFLKEKVEIINDDFEKAIDLAKENDFVFIDPPYRKRADYAVKNFEEFDHQRLYEKLKTAKFKWMIVHCDDEFYRESYKSFKIIDKNFQYNINFKNRKTDNQKVNHLYILNY
jgi:DNA adenine methylase